MFKISIFKHEQNAQKLRDRYHGSDCLPLKITVKTAVRIISLYWFTKDSRFSWFLLALILTLTGGAIFLAKVLNAWSKAFWDTIQEYDLEGFKHQLMVFAIIATIHVFVSVYNAYLRSQLSIQWRRWLTGKVMHDYLEESVFYKMQLSDSKTENPDQRISEDLSSFVSLTISLILGTLTDLALLITFSLVLWDLSQSVTMTLWNGYELTLPDGYMLYLALIYAAVGTFFTFVIGKPLVKLNFRQQRYEADFRFSLIRVRENSESISLYDGHKSEEKVLRNRFSEVVKNYVNLIKREKILGFFTLSYFQLAVIFPILIAAPMYFAKVITIGSIMQINSAFSRVQDALSTLINSFSSWASYKAVIDRLALFFDSMDSCAQIECIKAKKQGKVLWVKDLCVKTPVNDVLCSELNLELAYGQSLLIRGPSGCGKSTLIKTLAGLWPYAQGQIFEPDESRSLFLSQRPYLPEGTLREAVCYPGAVVTDGSVEKYMKMLSLDHLVGRLDETDLWTHRLSLGEQQRIALIRALLIRPEILFLDEASSALDERNESLSYDLIKRELKNSIIVSVGHRSTLISKHDLLLLPEQNWKLIKSSEI
ncbi:MAG: ABC transporter ATP-binding protein/permease [Succinivibrio sp.]